MNNQHIAQIFYEIADLLDIKGDSFFKSRAYRIAAQKIETIDEDLNTLRKKQDLTEIPGIGKII